MDLTKLRNNQIQLIEYMKKGGYSDAYIDKIRNELKRLLVFGEQYENYFDYYNNFIKPKTNIKNQTHKINYLTVIMNFDLHNEFPTRNHYKYKLIDSSNYSKLNNYFKNIIDVYKKEALKTNKKSTTIHKESLNCSCFLIYIQNIGHNDFNNVYEKDVISFFLNEKHELKFSHSYEKNIKIVLKSCVSYIPECKRIIDLIPTIKNTRKNIDYITNEEIKKIKEVLNDKNSNVSLRDKAIVALLLYLGIRGCDIVNLKLSNIDWNNETINIIQSKTEVPLELPLTTSVGNALYEYITNERPKVNLDNVFIRSDANYPITKSSAEIAVRHIFKEANIRQDNNKRKGTHIFRYNLATSLLKNEIPQPIISHVLGHATSESLKFYLTADFYHLKQCSLSIENFKNIKGVI